MRRLIAANAHRLNIEPAMVNRERLLAALCWKETRGWAPEWRQPNFEPAYYAGGRYFRPELVNRWETNADPILRGHVGVYVASSFGPWQVMFPVACELGFDGSPFELHEPRVNIEFAIRYINRRTIPRMTARREEEIVRQVADGFNSGNPVDRRTPEEYIAEVLAAYRFPDLFDRLQLLPRYYGDHREPIGPPKSMRTEARSD